ncbi:MAG TPA: enoyl-CoA hydratase family protein [Micromonosporaceae bacterium]|nr:enoyl-CoA hydratase family protein [Micromonosporaceae bacterium]
MTVRYDVDGPIATITLDSPGNRNALSRTLVSELTAALEEAGADPVVRAVVLTHTGKSFCAGGDLSEAGGGAYTQETTAIMSMLAKIVRLSKPVVAKVNGHVRAGGMGIVGACDIVVASSAASFGFTEVRIGVTPAIISLTTLDIMEPRQTARYYLTGEVFDAPTAERLGLVTVATAAEQLESTVSGFLKQIKETSPQGAAETKKLLNRSRRQSLVDNAGAMVDLSARLFASPEAQEGIHAFLQRRPASWLTVAD